MPKEEENESFSDRKRFVLGLREGLSGVKSLFVAITALVITLAEQRSKTKESSIVINKANIVKDLEPIQSTTTMNEYEVKSIVSNDPSKQYIYPVLAAISTITLVVGVSRLGPIAEWANNQNACIESVMNEEGFDRAKLSNQVKNCNGGHDWLFILNTVNLLTACKTYRLKSYYFILYKIYFFL